MGFLRETLINTGWIKPKPGEFLPEHQELGIAYQALALTFRDSRLELERRPSEEEIVRNLMGVRIKERTLRVVNDALELVPFTIGPRYVSIGFDHIFSLPSKRLLIRPGRGIRIDESLTEAGSQAWFEHGMRVADTTLDHLASTRGLPQYLARIQIPR